MADAKFELRSYIAEDCSHEHAFHQLVLPRAGILELEVSSHAGQVDASHGVLVVAGERHAFRGVGENRFLVVDLQPAIDAMPDQAHALWDRALSDPYFRIDPDFDHLTRFLLLEMVRGTPSAEFSHYWVNLLLLSLAERIRGERKTLPARVQRALHFIHQNYGSRLGAADVAAAVNLSASHLRDVFRACTGRTLHDYISDYRLSQAMQLLSNPKPSIAEIALRCGYSDQSALTRSLKRERGITPGDYREAFAKP